MSPLAWPSNVWRTLRQQSNSIQADESRRIFLIGHNKCGTRSFNKLLNKNGYSSIHYDKGRLAKRIQANFIFSRPLLDGVDQYCGYTDWSFVVSFMPIDFFLFWICNILGLVLSTTRVMCTVGLIPA